MRGYKNFESDPHPGDLRHLVEIGHTINEINENGYPESTDVVVCKVWAAVIDAGNQHYRAADVMNTEAVINFTIRYRTDIKSNSDWKFVHVYTEMLTTTLIQMHPTCTQIAPRAESWVHLSHFRSLSRVHLGPLGAPSRES